MPHSQEAKTKSAVEIRNNFTSPKRLASQPVIGIEIALATPKEVITQVPWLNDAPRSPEIVGIATFAKGNTFNGFLHDGQALVCVVANNFFDEIFYHTLIVVQRVSGIERCSTFLL